jgi:hypothetical protein
MTQAEEELTFEKWWHILNCVTCSQRWARLNLFENLRNASLLMSIVTALGTILRKTLKM